jgi:hypothetical protein
MEAVMPTKLCFSVFAVMILSVSLPITLRSTAQTKPQSKNTTGDSSLPTLMFIHGYTMDNPNYDLEHCFVQGEDDSGMRRPLFFDASTDFDVKKNQVYFKLFNRDGEVPMAPGTGWSVVKEGYTFTIKITDRAAPHLGPGPYSAMITVGAQATSAKRTWGYWYGTWKKSSSSPLDCLY